jgi:hypothetical protein
MAAFIKNKNSSDVKLEYPKKTTDLLQVTDKLYHVCRGYNYNLRIPYRNITLKIKYILIIPFIKGGGRRSRTTTCSNSV